MKHLVILLSLISTVLITGCGGGNAGGNAAGNPQEEQQIEEPQMMAEGMEMGGEPAFGQNLDPNGNVDQDINAGQDDNADQNGDGQNNNAENTENTDNTDGNNNEEAEGDKDGADNQDTDGNDKGDDATQDEVDDKGNDTTADTEVNNTETDNKDDLVIATGTVVLADNNNPANNTTIKFNAITNDLDPAAEREKINRVASADTPGSENIPNLASMLGE